MARLVRPKPEEPEEEPPPLLYSADAAARILGGVSTATIFRLVQRKELHPIKVGSRSLFTMDELQRFVKKQQAKPYVKRKQRS